MLLLAAGGIIGAIAYFNSRDDATVSSSQGPGRERPAGERPVVKAGNVLLLHSEAELAAPLRVLQSEFGGADQALVATGQAVLVRSSDRTAPVVALSAGHRLDATGPQDPALRNFVEYWLGRTPG